MRRRTYLRLASATILAIAFTTFVFWRWVIPGTITSRLRAIVPGTRVAFEHWSPGALHGVRWYEGPAIDAPLWASCERVDTGLTWGSIIRGETWPKAVVLVGADLRARLDPSGNLIGLSGQVHPELGLPDLNVSGGRLRIEQEGRPTFMVTEIEGTLKGDRDRLVLTAKTRDRAWGRWRVDGTLASDLATGSVTISGLDVDLKPEQWRSLPFVSSDVWRVVVPNGPVNVRLSVGLGDSTSNETWVDLKGADLEVPSIGATLETARGRIIWKEGTAQFDHVNGSAFDGTVGVDGTLTTKTRPANLHLVVRLEEAEIAAMPVLFGLGKSGLRKGVLTGQARVVARLGPDGTDLSGSEGEAKMMGAKLDGVVSPSASLRMTTVEGEVSYETRGGSIGP